MSCRVFPTLHFVNVLAYVRHYIILNGLQEIFMVNKYIYVYHENILLCN